MYVEQISENRYRELLSSSPEKLIMFRDRGEENLIRLDAGKLINNERLVVSESMKRAIDLNYYRRRIQIEFNEKHGITPTTILSSIKDIGIPNPKKKRENQKLSAQDREKEIKRLELEMDIAAANLEFERAAEIRDEILTMKKSKRKK